MEMARIVCSHNFLICSSFSLTKSSVMGVFIESMNCLIHLSLYNDHNIMSLTCDPFCSSSSSSDRNSNVIRGGVLHSNSKNGRSDKQVRHRIVVIVLMLVYCFYVSASIMTVSRALDLVCINRHPHCLQVVLEHEVRCMRVLLISMIIRLLNTERLWKMM